MGGNAGIVDHDVHSAPFVDQDVFQLLQVSDLGDITALVKRLDAQILQFCQCLFAPLVVDIGNDDFPAGPGETQSESLAEAAGAPGNGNALVRKTFHGEFLLFLFYSPLPTGERGWGRGLELTCKTEPSELYEHSRPLPVSLCLRGLPRREREITVSPSSASHTSSIPAWQSTPDALHRGRPPCAVPARSRTGR